MFIKMGRCGIVLLGFVTLAGIAAARPQAADTPPQSDSAATAARKARELKKADTKTARVWDNDNIVMPAGGVEVIGPDANAPATDANAGGATSDQTPAAAPAAISPEELAHAQAAIKEAQDKIAELKQQIDLSQRKYNLDAAMYYGKPEYEADKDGQKAINQEKGSLDDKKQQLKLTQQMLAELQAKIGTAPMKAPEAKPAETKPAETKTAETKPVEPKPEETKPPEPKPAAAQPAEPRPPDDLQ
ncbi:MAG TPA: hypothetical protein VLW83_11290 [Candidatus Acidoferrales bacterium]|nr:hypothetical protein [Candidatus Acidoferrum sp.]HUJ82458.1 hypothetical protein [Candidatus Acidoferrales bacterium]